MYSARVSMPTFLWLLARSTNVLHILNIAAINALCIYSANKNYVKVKRADFLDEISWEMVKPQIHERMKQSVIPRQLKSRGLMLLGEDSEDKMEIAKAKKEGKGRCTICGRSRNKSTRRVCAKCNEWVCVEHSTTTVVCKNCT